MSTRTPTATVPRKRHSSTAKRATTAAGKSTLETPAQSNQTSVPRLRIRMYRHGLGDCLLLRFRRENGNETFNLLIDCGLIMVAENAKVTMTKVAEDIAKVCDNRLDVVVMTHEHWDHASGFSEHQARAVFDNIKVGEVWYGWTEDPQNELGQRLRKERAQKVQTLARAVTALSADAANQVAATRATGISGILGFFGLDQKSAANGNIGKTRDAFDYLLRKQGVKTRYCAPDKPPISLQGVPETRVYVLGPPQDEGFIKKSTPSKKGREVYELASESRLASNLESAFFRLSLGQPASGMTAYDDCPFDPTLRRRDGSSSGRTSKMLEQLISTTWDAQGEEWRRIENDWTQVAETLALNLDSHTNNTCLVLAFEFTDTGEVFLFPADAQVGSWLSWQNLRWQVKSVNGSEEVTATDLLARTVFYKVGHHGSHNATLRTHGLEQMVQEDLVAFIPVFREQAIKNRWLGMPCEPLVRRLSEKTSGRLLRSDAGVPRAEDLVALTADVRQRFLHSLDSDKDDLWFEYKIE